MVIRVGWWLSALVVLGGIALAVLEATDGGGGYDGIGYVMAVVGGAWFLFLIWLGVGVAVLTRKVIGRARRARQSNSTRGG